MAADKNFGIALWDYNPLFRFSFTLAIRIEAVEEIVNRFSGSLPKNHDVTLTSITQLEFLGLPAEPGGGVEYRAHSKAELAAILPGVCAMVRERILPFFEEYRDIAALNRGLNPEGADQIVQAPWPPDRRAFDALVPHWPYHAMTRVAVAFLAGDPRFTGLVAAYRTQISGLPDDELLKYEQLVDYLLGA